MCDKCPNCGGDGPSIYSATAKRAFGGGTLYGVCKRCADNFAATSETDEQIKAFWDSYHRRYHYGL